MEVQKKYGKTKGNEKNNGEQQGMKKQWRIKKERKKRRINNKLVTPYANMKCINAKCMSITF